jgi:hypothetical protein
MTASASPEHPGRDAALVSMSATTDRSAPGLTAARPAPAASGHATAPTASIESALIAQSTNVPVDTEVANTRRQGGVWAVVVGIDDYPGTKSDLRGAVNDADSVVAALSQYGVPAERRLVLRNEHATSTGIREALRWLVEHADVDATAVVFYAGHVRKLTSTAESLVASDGRLVSDADVAELLDPMLAAQAWIAIAACYGGGFTEVLGPGRVLTAAADADELAYETSSYQGSYLVEFMVRRAMIEGRGAGSVEEAFAWAAAELRREHPHHVPVQHDRAPGDIRLGPAPPAAPPPAPAAPPSQPQPQDPTVPPEEPTTGEADDDSCVVRFGALLDCPD